MIRKVTSLLHFEIMQAFQQGVTTTKTGPDLNTFGICYTELWFYMETAKNV